MDRTHRIYSNTKDGIRNALLTTPENRTNHSCNLIPTRLQCIQVNLLGTLFPYFVKDDLQLILRWLRLIEGILSYLWDVCYCYCDHLCYFIVIEVVALMYGLFNRNVQQKEVMVIKHLHQINRNINFFFGCLWTICFTLEQYVRIFCKGSIKTKAIRQFNQFRKYFAL